MLRIPRYHPSKAVVISTPFHSLLCLVYHCSSYHLSFGLLHLQSYPAMPNPTRPKKIFTQKVHQTGVYLCIGHVESYSPSTHQHSLVSLLQHGIRTQRCTKRSSEGKHMSKCLAAQQETLHFLTLSAKPMVADCGCWAVIGPTSQEVFKDASGCGDFGLMKENLLAQLSHGALVFAKLVVHNDHTVSVLWHRVWNV